MSCVGNWLLVIDTVDIQECEYNEWNVSAVQIVLTHRWIKVT